MSSSRALCCLPSVKKQKHDFHFFPVQCIIKQLLGEVFVISRIIKVSVRVNSLSLRLRLITPTSTLIILDITKTSSNNCLKFACRALVWFPFCVHGIFLIYIPFFHQINMPFLKILLLIWLSNWNTVTS